MLNAAQPFDLELASLIGRYSPRYAERQETLETACDGFDCSD
jgi:hypothetical protein